MIDYTVWKNDNFTLTWKKFRENDLQFYCLVKIWFDGSFVNDLKCESKIKQIFYTVDDEFEFLVKWDCCAKTQSHNLLTCQSFDPWSFEKSWGRISTIIFKLIVLDDVLVADGVPTDSNADVGGHLWFHGRKSLNATKSEPPTNSY